MKYLSKVLILILFIIGSDNVLGNFIYGTYSLKHDIIETNYDENGDEVYTYKKITKGRYLEEAEISEELAFVRSEVSTVVTPMNLLGNEYVGSSDGLDGKGYYGIQYGNGNIILLEEPMGDVDKATYEVAEGQNITFEFNGFDSIDPQDPGESNIQLIPKSVIVKPLDQDVSSSKKFSIILQSEVIFDINSKSDFENGEDVIKINDRIVLVGNTENYITLRGLYVREYYGEFMDMGDRKPFIRLQISLDNRKSKIEMIDNESIYTMDFGIGVEGEYLDTSSEYGSSAEIVVTSAKEAILALEMKDITSGENNIVNLERDGIEIKCDISPSFEDGANIWRDLDAGDPRRLFYLTGYIPGEGNLEDKGKGKIVINGQSQLPISNEPSGTYSGTIEVTVSYEE